MKIGIVTFHRAENFGAALQVYSLQEYLKLLGHSVEIIDYRNKAIERQYDIYDISFLFRRKNIFASLSVLFTRIVTYPVQKKKKNKYSEFRKKYLQISERVHSVQDFFENDYDVYICGSDQVWNPYLTDGLDPVYFLNFPVQNACKKISYAASSEYYAYPYYKKEHEVLQAYLSNLDALSVREESLANELSTYTSKKIEAVLDPVFLFDRSFYIKILKDPGVRNYILVYHLFESRIASRGAADIANEKNLNVIEIHAGFKPFVNNNKHKQDLGPCEFLGFIYYADLILTTSFHGTALSLILHKNFYVVNTGGIIRIKDLLRELKMEDRIVDTTQEIHKNLAVDYNAVESRLLPLISRAKVFLSDHL